MKITVIGANGFVGKTLVRQLAKENHRIVAIDRQFDDDDSFDGDVQVCPVDVLQIERTVGYITGSSVIVYCAMPVEGIFAQNPDGFRLETSPIIQYLANLVEMTNASFIFMSDWKVYGRPLKMVSEDDQPTPNTAFGKYLFYSEMAVRHLIPEATILRTGEIWGIGSSHFEESMSIPNRIAFQIAKNGFFDRLDDEYSYFPLISVDDVCSAIREAIVQKVMMVTLNCYQRSVNYFQWCEEIDCKYRSFSGYIGNSVDMRGTKFHSLYQPKFKLNMLDLISNYKEIM